MATNLFEYKFEKLPDNLHGETLKEFKQFLNEVWQKYKEEKPTYWRENLYEDENDEAISKKQKFLFFQDGQVKSRNYVGYIKFKDFEFNLYPKICSQNNNKEKINNMLFLWLQYSNNNILPRIETNLSDYKNCDFIEILIYLFAKYTSDLLAISIYQHYEEISEETTFLKGKLNFTEYIKNIVCGKQHKFHCTYDSFEVNNKFNQIIKYVAKCLYGISKNTDNQNYLQDILYTLDDVDDVVCTAADCDSVYINRFMGEFNTVLDYCKLFLNNSITFNESGDFDNFAFLLRTEVLFEDFISNFAKEQFPNISITAQSQKKLDIKEHFHYRPDLIISDEDKKVIKVIDIKYKDINSYNNVSQVDIYQCISYTIKENCTNITLLYPNFNQEKNKLDSIEINTELLPNNNIKISFVFIDCCRGDDINKIAENIKTDLKNILRPNLTGEHDTILSVGDSPNHV